MSDDRRYWDKEWLADQLEQGYTQEQIADKTDSSRATIGKWVKKHGLAEHAEQDGIHGVKNVFSNAPLPKHDLYEFYWRFGDSTREIADRFDVSTSKVFGWMADYGIPRREPSETLSDAVQNYRRSRIEEPDVEERTLDWSKIA